MKEKPILFSGEMVRAILDGRKTQTRRVIKPQPRFIKDQTGCKYLQIPGKGVWFDDDPMPSTYGQPGDRLWVRETFCPVDNSEFADSLGEGDEKVFWIDYRATPKYGMNSPAGWDEDQKDNPDHAIWRPSIFMPRKYSRILLEITNIRVERLQEISEEDAIAEGIDPNINPAAPQYISWSNKRAYEYLWDCLNAKRGFGWNANPWVWVIEFKVIQ
ncbi:MAG: hypothetical protein AB9897_01130 [Anaerolineaceae bacterium]